MRRSRNSWIAAVALVVIAEGAPSAHRRDEYLQAARVAISPDRVEIELDLTPGIAVAERVLAGIDLDGNRSISDSEALAYAGQVVRAMAADVDGTPLGLEIVSRTFPEVEAMRNGAGAIRIEAAAGMPRLSAGTHHLRYRNSHCRDIGVYLVNALVPASGRVAVAAQRRDIEQRDVTIEYTLAADSATRIRGGLTAAVAAAILWTTALWWRRATRSAATARLPPACSPPAPSSRRSSRPSSSTTR